MADRSVRRGLGLIALAVVAILVMLLVPKHTKRVHPANDDPWLLVSYDPNNKYGTYLGNGFISTRIMGDGVGSQDGQPLPCYMAGLYDDEKLIQMPTWSDLRFYDGKTQFKIDKDADYKQVLNMKTGILTTYATWRAGSKALKGKIEVIVSRARPNVGLVRATVVPNFDGVVVAPDANIGAAPSPALHACIVTGIDDQPRDGLSTTVASLITAHGKVNMFLTQTSVPAKLSDKGVPVKRQISVSFCKWTTVSGKRDWDQSRRDLALSVEEPTRFIAEHKAAWAKLWKKDIIIDGPKKDQQAIHSCMFYLLQSVREGSQWSITPMGLSNNAYMHVFWDADTWIFPALILQHPELARSIVDYRYNTLPAAMANAKNGTVHAADAFSGAEYAWESGMTGKEDTQPGLVYRNERHIDGDIALAQWQYYLATNDLNWLKTRGFPVIKATADYWASRAVSANGRYEIKQVVPPDENANLVNNSVYTNAIAKMNLEIASRAAKLAGQAANPKWSTVAQQMYIPLDAKAERFIAFDGYKGMKAKQADSELLAYPLQFNIPGQDMAKIYKNTLDFYAPKVLPKGPAMSTSAHSVIAARLKDCDRAYTYFTKSYRPYLYGPFNYFNEKPSEFINNTCFLTGCAGPIQASIYGLAGVHMDYFPKDPATAKLSFAPCLPKQWKGIKITGIQWHGKAFDISVTKGNKVKVTEQ